MYAKEPDAATQHLTSPKFVHKAKNTHADREGKCTWSVVPNAQNSPRRWLPKPRYCCNLHTNRADKHSRSASIETCPLRATSHKFRAGEDGDFTWWDQTLCILRPLFATVRNCVVLIDANARLGSIRSSSVGACNPRSCSPPMEIISTLC